MKREHRNGIGRQVWWQLMRPHTLTAAIMPVLMGTSMAYAEGSTFDLFLFAAMMSASVLIQAAVNMFNEYFDYKRGLDSIESVGIGGAIVRKELEEKTVLAAAIVFFSVSVVLGAYICLRTSWWIAAIGSVSMAVGFFYSAGRSPLAYTPFGEAASGFFMGPVIVLISYYIQRKTLTMTAVLIAVPISILVAAILMANNIRDAEGDARKGRKTLAIIFGRDSAITILERMLMTSFLWTAGLVLLNFLTPWVLIVLVAVPKANRAVKIFRSGKTAVEMMPAMKAVSVVHTQFGLLFSTALLLGRLVAVR